MEYVQREGGSIFGLWTVNSDDVPAAGEGPVSPEPDIARRKAAIEPTELVELTDRDGLSLRIAVHIIPWHIDDGRLLFGRDPRVLLEKARGSGAHEGDAGRGFVRVLEGERELLAVGALCDGLEVRAGKQRGLDRARRAALHEACDDRLRHLPDRPDRAGEDRIYHLGLAVAVYMLPKHLFHAAENDIVRRPQAG